MTTACSCECRPFPPKTFGKTKQSVFGGKGRHNGIPCYRHLAEIL